MVFDVKLRGSILPLTRTRKVWPRVEFNAAARRLFGYSRSEILGREIADTIAPPALRDELRRRLRDFVLTGDSRDLGRPRETTAMRADGSLVPVQVVVKQRPQRRLKTAGRKPTIAGCSL